MCYWTFMHFSQAFSYWATDPSQSSMPVWGKKKTDVFIQKRNLASASWGDCHQLPTSSCGRKGINTWDSVITTVWLPTPVWDPQFWLLQCLPTLKRRQDPRSEASDSCHKAHTFQVLEEVTLLWAEMKELRDQMKYGPCWNSWLWWWS